MAEHVYALTVTYNNAGQFAQNVFKYQFDDVGYTDTASAALALCNAFISAKIPKIQAVIPTHVTIVSVKARSIEGGGGFEAVVLAAPGLVGLRTGNQQNSAVGPVALWGPANNAKARGKTFFPGVTDTDLVDGTFTAAFDTAFFTQMGLFLADMILVGGGAPTAVFGIRQRKPTVSFLPATYVRLVRIPGTLRKRQRPA